jgi:hypothetical protein
VFLFGGEAQDSLTVDDLGSRVGGHNDDRVAEVYGAPLRFGEPSVLQYLQKDVNTSG